MQYGDVQQLSNDYLSLYFGANAKFKFLDDDEDDHYLEPPTLQVTTFEIHYGKLAQYGMKHMLISFANICNAGIRTEQMVEASAEACAGRHPFQSLKLSSERVRLYCTHKVENSGNGYHGPRSMKKQINNCKNKGAMEPSSDTSNGY
ncbi:hypothetical protein GOBAR_DD12390 [Gossypium barbadense]|nr:hypothetical protein GOBAR_DD12390 [Gossypium barbadense]